MTSDFMDEYRNLCRAMLTAPVIHTGSWQSTNTANSPMHATHEIEDVIFTTTIPDSMFVLQRDMEAVNLPWAEKHFEERVGGEPVNPPPSHVDWPWARHNKRFQNGDQGPFSHSYPERMWARYTGGRDISGLEGDFETSSGDEGLYRVIDGHRVGGPIDLSRYPKTERKGVRYRYGDLNDLVDLIMREPLTRQAYLPIWFPEDTGTHHGERVPCTLGYHFMVRDRKLSCRYYMRSCDLIRHFADDVYMAARLTQWICDEVNDRWETLDEEAEYIHPGRLIMYISSLHAFVGDEFVLKGVQL